MRYGLLTYEEIRDRALRGWLAIVPTGCTEQQGPHLSVDFDTWFVEQLCIVGSEKAELDFGTNSLVLPAMPFGPTPEHRNYGSGFIDIPSDIHESIVFNILTSLANQGFQKIIIWRGCGQHKFDEVLVKFNQQFFGKSKAYLPDLDIYHIIWSRISHLPIPGGHADSFSTSIALYLRPDSVRTNKILNPYSQEPDWDNPNLDFKRHSSTGVIGDPTHASTELGKELWAAVVEHVASTFKTIALNGEK
jgi:creatinine amidohydrolase